MRAGFPAVADRGLQVVTSTHADIVTAVAGDETASGKTRIEE